MLVLSRTLIWDLTATDKFRINKPNTDNVKRIVWVWCFGEHPESHQQWPLAAVAFPHPDDVTLTIKTIARLKSPEVNLYATVKWNQWLPGGWKSIKDLLNTGQSILTLYTSWWVADTQTLCQSVSRTLFLAPFSLALSPPPPVLPWHRFASF